MGLLDGFFSDDPRQQAQLALAMGLLSGGGGKGVGGFARDLGRAGIGAQSAYNQASLLKDKRAEEEQQRKFREMQMGEMQRGLDYNKAFGQAITPAQPEQNRFALNDPNEPGMYQPAKPQGIDWGQLQRVDPRRALQDQMAFNKTEAPIVLKDGERAYDRTGKHLFGAPKQEEKWEMVPADQARALGLPGGQGFQKNAATGQLRAVGSAPPVTNVNVSADKGYATTLAEGLAKQDLAAIDAAKSAPMRLQTARAVKAALDKGNLITGAGAEPRVALEKALSQAGLVGNERVANTEQLASLLANQTLDSIKTSGLGSGQGFTDKDRIFLQDASAGRITLEPQTIRRIAVLNEMAAAHHISNGNKVLSKIRKTKGFENFTIDDVQPMPPAAPSQPAQSGGLTPSEQEELARLRAQFGKS